MIPIYQSVSMIFIVIAGLTVLGESDRYSTKNLVGISFGMIIAVCGIFVIGYKKKSFEDTENQHTILAP